MGASKADAFSSEQQELANCAKAYNLFDSNPICPD